MKKIDTHQHLLYPKSFRYTWADEFAALKKEFSLEDYWSAAENCDVEGTLFMEVDVDEGQSGEEARFICDLAEYPVNRIQGVIASGRPEHVDFEAYLESIAHPKLKAIRRILHTQPDELIGNIQLRDSLRLLPKHELPFDLCALQRQLPLAGELIADCPETQFILDHCGNPEIADGNWKSWSVLIRKLAEYPNLVCKTSGIVAYAAEEQLNTEGLRPYVETVIEAFGWDRVLWGSDWPVCTLTSNLHQWVEILDEILISESHENLEKLFSSNARRVYQLT
jgi:predicted TIM-barrel fold metal-dependent hydrolase